MRHRGKRPTPVQCELRRIAEAIEQEWVKLGDPPETERGFWSEHLLADGCCWAAVRLNLSRYADECVVGRFTPSCGGFIAPVGTLWAERILWLYLLAEAGEEVAYR